MGSARSQGELDRATQLARYVPGVQRVVSYVELRYGAPVAAMPPPRNSRRRRIGRSETPSARARRRRGADRGAEAVMSLRLLK